MRQKEQEFYFTGLNTDVNNFVLGKVSLGFIFLVLC